MSSTIETEETIRVGEETVVTSDSPAAEYAVVFEDDGETGYLYGVDMAGKDSQILDGLHIYNVSNVVDRDKPPSYRWNGLRTD